MALRKVLINDPKLTSSVCFFVSEIFHDPQHPSFPIINYKDKQNTIRFRELEQANV